jgi:YidC/Oxa1 family membrane protein insertase
MDPLYQAIGWLLSIFYAVIPNFGISIILLTCTVMLVLFPLTRKQTRSMIAMQQVQPEIKKIQQRYKDDRQKQNEELMRFYQENKINPLAGCLPILMQMPVFIALFGVLRHPEDHIPTSSDLFHKLCGGARDAAACGTPRGLRFLGMNLSTAAADAGKVVDSFAGRLPYLLMVGLVVLTGWYQAYQTQLRVRRQGNVTPQTQQMMIITRVLPIVFGVVSYQFASGLVVYYVTSNLFRIGQQHFVLNKYYEEAREQAAAKKARPPATPAGGEEITGPATSASAGGPASGSRPSQPSRHASRKKRKRRR